MGFAADGFLIYYSTSGAYDPSYELSTEVRTGTDCIVSGPAGESIAIDGTTPDGTYNTDWAFDASLGDLDSCNGIEIDGAYAYILTDEYPFAPRCLNGEVAGGGGPGGGGAGQGGGAPGGAPEGGGAPAGNAQGGGAGEPDFGQAAAALGITEEELVAALGGPQPDLVEVAEILGVTVEELEAALPGR